jgi:hypothetical protein
MEKEFNYDVDAIAEVLMKKQSLESREIVSFVKQKKRKLTTNK